MTTPRMNAPVRAALWRHAAASALSIGYMASPAWSQAGPTAFDEAMTAYEASHYATAAVLLSAPATVGHLRSLEVLGLMHWYGERLYGAGPWDRSTGEALLTQAAGNGSEFAAAWLQSRRFARVSRGER